MRRTFISGLVAVLALGACQVSGQVAVGPKVTPTKKPEAAATDAPSGSPAPAGTTAARPTAAAPTPKVTPTAVPIATGGTLKAPTGAATKLSGTVRVDAAYMIAAGAGNVLSHNGGAIVAAGGLNALPDGGGGNLVAAGGQNLVAAGGLNFAPGGGGKIVAAGGLNLVAAGGLNYRVKQATAAPKAGEQVPAAGMMVSVVSLADRKYLPLGKDGAGQDVYAVLTNADGGYEVFVPPGEEANLLVVAQVPGTRDDRLVYNAFTAREAAATPVVLDEDAAAGTSYLRRAFLARVVAAMTSDDTDKMIGIFLEEAILTPALRATLTPIVTYFRALALERGVRPNEDPRVVEALARTVVDASLAMTRLDEVMIEPATAPSWGNRPKVNALQTLGQVMKELRVGAAAKMANAAGGYQEAITPAILQRVNGPLPTEPLAAGDVVPPLLKPDRRILRPADINDFVVEEYLGVPRNWVWDPLTNLYATLDPATYPDEAARYVVADDRTWHLRNAVAALAQRMALGLVPEGENPTVKPTTTTAAAVWAAGRAFDIEAARKAATAAP